MSRLIFSMPIKILIALLLFFPLSSFSAENPLARRDGLNIRLVPENPESLFGAITVEVSEKRGALNLEWATQYREEIQNTPVTGSSPWPSYRVRLLRGVIRAEKEGPLVFPPLWKTGFVSLEHAGLLWAPHEIARHPSGEFVIDPGFLSPETDLLSQGEGVASHMNDFRQMALSLLSPEKPPGAEKKKIGDFLESLGRVRIKEKSAAPLVVNEEKVDVPVLIAGNSFLEYTILDFPENPLILKLMLDPQKVPAIFKNFFDYFKLALEYRVTQIQTMN